MAQSYISYNKVYILELIEQETHWLLELPNNELWSEMKNRIQLSLDENHGYAATNKVANQYLNYELEKSDLVFNQALTELFFKVSYHLAGQIMEEAVAAIIVEICQSISNSIADCGRNLDQDIINVSV